MPIYKTKDLIRKQTDILLKYQSGEINIVKTGRDHIDATLTGLLPGDIVVIAGASGSGKTFELQTLRENIMNVDINPNAENFVFLDYSFEMKLFNLILRGISKILNKAKQLILLNKFKEEERPLVNRYIKTMSDDRFFIDETPCTAEEFLTQTREFLEANRDKEAVFVAIDHMALFKSTGDKKASIDKVVEGINILKREFENAYFILLSQLNRGILGRIKDKDINAMPNRSDVFQSDTMFHIADYLVVVHNPHRLGITDYLRVNPRIYEMLSDFFSAETGTSRKVSFRTFGNIFFHVLKVREGEVVFQDIYIEEIHSENVEMYREEMIDVVTENFDDLNIDGFTNEGKF